MSILLSSLREHVKTSGISIAEIARRVDRERQAVSRDIHGHNMPSIDRVEAIAQAIGMEVVIRQSQSPQTPHPSAP